MPYVNDVFISYKRGRINEQWLNDIFLPLFTDYLDNALPHKVKIFVDKEGLTPGVFFNEELFVNLIQSKCIVSIWSPPSFFKSIWCLMEFLTMKQRQEKLGLGATTKPKSLIWPVLYRGLEAIPEVAAGITYMDYTGFNLVGDAFFRTERYLDFQTKLQNDIKAIASMIKDAPPLSPELESAEGMANLERELKTYFSTNITNDEVKQQPCVDTCP